MGATRLFRVSLSGVVPLEDLADCLRRAGQKEWCTRVRMRGLLLLIDFVVRNHASRGVSISTDLAHNFVSGLWRPKSRSTIREPLAILCHIGILRCVRPAVNGWHLKTSAMYALDGVYAARRIALEVDLPSCLAKKHASASVRCEERRNRRYPFRPRLLMDLTKLSLAFNSRRLILELSHNPKLRPSVKRAVEALDGVNHWVRISPREQITTSVTGCPRKLKAFLLLGEEPVVFCDISHAHHCFLPALLSGRIDYLKRTYGSGADTSNYEAELERLTMFLSDGDYYRKLCVDPEDDSEREQKKSLLTMFLNWPNVKCQENRLYRRMRKAFPLVFTVCEDIKRKHHRDISKPLQYYTAKAINGALLEAQAKGIAAIPDVDAIICQARHKVVVCRLIGQKVHEFSCGVCCKVGGIRYEPRRASPLNSSSCAETALLAGEATYHSSSFREATSNSSL